MFTILSAHRGARPVTQAEAEVKAAVAPTSDEAQGDDTEVTAIRTKMDAARPKLNAFNQHGKHEVTFFKYNL